MSTVSQLDTGPNRVSSTALQGRTALVTGASGGIGAAIAAALASSGVAVGLVGRRSESLRRVVRRIGPAPHCLYQADLSSDAQVRGLARSFLRRFGRLDMLVHSHGAHSSAPLTRARVRDFDRLWTTNVRSPFLLTQLLIPALRATAGQILFVNSSMGLETRAGIGQYAATKHALRALAETLRAELNPEGIRVINIYPGRTATNLQRRLFREEGRPFEPERLLQPEDIADVVIGSLGLARTAEVTDLLIRPMLKLQPLTSEWSAGSTRERLQV
jgi:NAD(P)-dependent dehydrogenase (short-subunit alcohol dehydrogenase family)